MVAVILDPVMHTRTPLTPKRPVDANAELHCFVSGLWTGLGIACVGIATTWLIVRRVQEVRAEGALPSRIDRAIGQDTFTIGDYSGLDANDGIRAQMRAMEDSYAARERNRAAIQESLTRTDLSGRTEVQPWLVAE